MDKDILFIMSGNDLRTNGIETGNFSAFHLSKENQGVLNHLKPLNHQ